MKVTDRKYLSQYMDAVGYQIPRLISEFDFSEANGAFDFLTKASAVYSSNIEGNTIDLNSFMNYELNKEKFKAGKEIEEIDNLIRAYEFAQQNEVSEENLLRCHRMLSETLLIKSKRGQYRVESVGVFSKSGLVYLAVESEYVKKEMGEFFKGISELLEQPLTGGEVFYFASLIHLRFVHIHPFSDGNGRVARLLEKWFVAEKLGDDFWKIPSEEYYKENLHRYYDSINLGVNFYELNYDGCIDFLSILPGCLSGRL